MKALKAAQDMMEEMIVAIVSLRELVMVCGPHVQGAIFGRVSPDLMTQTIIVIAFKFD